MRLDAVRTAGGEPLLEECLDIAGLHGRGRCTTSAGSAASPTPAPAASTSSSPRCTGPDEVSLSVDLFTAVEQALELPPTTVKIGIMDEERRTSLNLEACIARAAERVIFVNTGFLDRTGDEIHSASRPARSSARTTRSPPPGCSAYEDRNVDVALRAGFAGHAQIGKGMWAQPAGMRAMLDTKGRPAEGRREHRLGALADGGHPARAALPGDRREGRAGRAGGAPADGPAQAAGRAGAAGRRRGAHRRRRSATSSRPTRSRSSATSCAGSGWASAARRCRTWRASA